MHRGCAGVVDVSRFRNFLGDVIEGVPEGTGEENGLGGLVCPEVENSCFKLGLSLLLIGINSFWIICGDSTGEIIGVINGESKG
ncbi:hypothetical protein B1135_11930 [Enterococcus faecium]|nr:hypothetical protein B1135_11930 [Enterococcus faecium]